MKILVQAVCFYRVSTSLASLAAMNRKPSYVSLSAYYEGIANAIDARLKASKQYLQHPSIGFSAEAYFRDLLRSYLPSRYAVESGFVVDASGKRSDHIDIVVADTLHIPALCSEPGYKVFAAESVCAVIEVTTSPKGRKKIPKFEADIDKLAHVRRLALKREYIDFQPVEIDGQAKFLPARFTLEGSPRCFLITSGMSGRLAKPIEEILSWHLRSRNRRGTLVG